MNRKTTTAKRLFALLLCLTLGFALIACGETDTPSSGSAGSTETTSATKTDPAPSTDTAPVTDTTPATDTAQPSDTSSETPEKKVGFDDSIEHKFLACDITNHSVVIFDLNACEGDFQKLKDDSVSVVWEWIPEKDPNCKDRPSSGIDSAKYRYSPYYGKDVIIACSSNGWCGVIDYEKCSLIWEYSYAGGGPHSVEMLPNGDLVVSVSNNPGALSYIPLSAGATRPVSKIDSLYCHGVSWDPVNELLWVLEDDGVYAAEILNMGTMQGKIMRINGMKFAFDGNERGGHAFSPVYGEPGCYWASSGKYLWKFNSETEKITRNYNRSSILTAKANIKGIASFEDGTVVETVAGWGGKTTKDWSCAGFRIITRKLTTGKVQTVSDEVTEVYFETSHREFYKVQPFTKNYQ